MVCVITVDGAQDEGLSLASIRSSRLSLASIGTYGFSVALISTSGGVVVSGVAARLLSPVHPGPIHP